MESIIHASPLVNNIPFETVHADQEPFPRLIAKRWVRDFVVFSIIEATGDSQEPPESRREFRTTAGGVNHLHDAILTLVLFGHFGFTENFSLNLTEFLTLGMCADLDAATLLDLHGDCSSLSTAEERIAAFDRLYGDGAWRGFFAELLPPVSELSDVERIAHGVPEGQRNASATQMAGSLLHRFPGQQWETVAWPLLQGWNQKNRPPLEEAELRRTFESIASAEQAKRTDHNIEKGTKPLLVRMDTVRPEKVEWLWHPYLPRRKIVGIFGDPDAGKTTLSLVVTAAITRGLPLPGEQGRREPGRVLYLTAEDGLADTIRTRLDQNGADCSKVVILHGRVTNGEAKEGPIALSHDIDLVRQAVEEVRPSLVFFDPIQGYLGATVDMHRSNQTRPVLAQLLALGEEYNFTSVMIGHLTKSQRDRALYRLLGSIDFAALVRSILIVGQDPESGQRVMIHEKHNLSAKGASLAFHIDEADGGFSWTGESTLTTFDLLRPQNGDGRGTLEEAIDFIREFVTKPTLSDEIFAEGERRGISRRTLFRAKKELGIIARKRGEPGIRVGKGQAEPWEWPPPS